MEYISIISGHDSKMGRHIGGFFFSTEVRRSHGVETNSLLIALSRVCAGNNEQPAQTTASAGVVPFNKKVLVSE